MLLSARRKFDTYIFECLSIFVGFFLWYHVKCQFLPLEMSIIWFQSETVETLGDFVSFFPRSSIYSIEFATHHSGNMRAQSLISMSQTRINSISEAYLYLSHVSSFKDISIFKYVNAASPVIKACGITFNDTVIMSSCHLRQALISLHHRTLKSFQLHRWREMPLRHHGMVSADFNNKLSSSLSARKVSLFNISTLQHFKKQKIEHI